MDERTTRLYLLLVKVNIYLYLFIYLSIYTDESIYYQAKMRGTTSNTRQ